MTEDDVGLTWRFWKHFTSALFENQVVFTVRSVIFMKFCFSRRQSPKTQNPTYLNTRKQIGVEFRHLDLRECLKRSHLSLRQSTVTIILVYGW